MGCRNDYMAPREDELKSIHLAGLAKYMLEKLGYPVPSWMVTAAKGEYQETSLGSSVYGAPNKLDELTVLLCSTIRGFSQRQLDAIVYDAKNKTSRDLADFWEDHQETDKRRVQRDKEERAADEKEYLRLQKKLGLSR